MEDKEKMFIKEQTKKYNDILYECDKDIDDFSTMLLLMSKHYPNEIDVITDFKEIVEGNLETTKNLKRITKEMIKMLQAQCVH